jgi:hypothetical protein
VRPRRTFDTPELLLIRFLLERVLRCIADLAIGAIEGRAGWTGSVAALHTAAARSRAHAALRDLPVTWPTAEQRVACARSRDPAVRAAVNVASHHDRLLPRPAPDALEATVTRFALAPLDVNKRFELFVLLNVMDLIAAAVPDCPREDNLISHDRAEVTCWHLPGGKLRLFYDQSPEPAWHADVIHHYFGTTSSVRPDVRLQWESATSSCELYIDAKFSDEIGYLTQSHLKMLGYITEAPHRFMEPGPKVILVAPRTVLRDPRPLDAVGFVGADDCGSQGRLHRLVASWLALAVGS